MTCNHGPGSNATGHQSIRTSPETAARMMLQRIKSWWLNYNRKIDLGGRPSFSWFIGIFLLYCSQRKKCILNNFAALPWFTTETRPVWHQALDICTDPPRHHCTLGVDADHRCKEGKMRVQLFVFHCSVASNSCLLLFFCFWRHENFASVKTFDRLTLARRPRSSSLGLGPVVIGAERRESGGRHRAHPAHSS